MRLLARLSFPKPLRKSKPFEDAGEEAFEFELALALGHPVPDVLMARIPNPLFYRWLEFARFRAVQKQNAAKKNMNAITWWL
jgi:hypothetical protein